jgi:hypothetical protein
VGELGFVLRRWTNALEHSAVPRAGRKRLLGPICRRLRGRTYSLPWRNRPRGSSSGCCPRSRWDCFLILCMCSALGLHQKFNVSISVSPPPSLFCSLLYRSLCLLVPHTFSGNAHWLSPACVHARVSVCVCARVQACTHARLHLPYRRAHMHACIFPS